MLKEMREANEGRGVKRRRLFGPNDDRRLQQIIDQHEFNGWKSVAKLMPGFTPKQLRDRWHNYISPKNSFGPWRPEEDQMIIQKVAEFGTKWSLIASFIKGRSDNSIKNRWNTALKDKALKKTLRSSQQNGSSDPPDVGKSTTVNSPIISIIDEDKKDEENVFLDSRFIDYFFERVKGEKPVKNGEDE